MDGDINFTEADRHPRNTLPLLGRREIKKRNRKPLSCEFCRVRKCVVSIAYDRWIIADYRADCDAIALFQNAVTVATDPK